MKVELLATLKCGKGEFYEKGTILEAPLPYPILREVELNKGTVRVLSTKSAQPAQPAQQQEEQPLAAPEPLPVPVPVPAPEPEPVPAPTVQRKRTRKPLK